VPWQASALWLCCFPGVPLGLTQARPGAPVGNWPLASGNRKLMMILGRWLPAMGAGADGQGRSMGLTATANQGPPPWLLHIRHGHGHHLCGHVPAGTVVALACLARRRGGRARRAQRGAGGPADHLPFQRRSQHSGTRARFVFFTIVAGIDVPAVWLAAAGHLLARRSWPAWLLL